MSICASSLGLLQRYERPWLRNRQGVHIQVLERPDDASKNQLRHLEKSATLFLPIFTPSFLEHYKYILDLILGNILFSLKIH
ncbi:hypothetical protein Bca4012_042874 [Brassica carinata]